MTEKINQDLLKILICPQSRAPLVQVGDWLFSTDPDTRRKYPIREGVPILLIDESQEANSAEFKQALDQANLPDSDPSDDAASDR